MFSYFLFVYACYVGLGVLAWPKIIYDDGLAVEEIFLGLLATIFGGAFVFWAVYHEHFGKYLYKFLTYQLVEPKYTRELKRKNKEKLV